MIYTTNVGYLIETRSAIDCWVLSVYKSNSPTYILTASFTRSNDGLIAAKRFLDRETEKRSASNLIDK